jgi:hypothetical protein
MRTSVMVPIQTAVVRPTLVPMHWLIRRAADTDTDVSGQRSARRSR